MFTRICKRCNLIKNVQEFPVDSRNSSWKNKICKRCNSIRSNLNARRKKIWNKYNWLRDEINLEEAYKVYETEKCCKICGSTEKLHLDHCHKTKIVRGMLCHKCNRALGFFNDNSDLLRKAANYIDKLGRIVYN